MALEWLAIFAVSATVKNDIILVTGGLGFIGKYFVRRCLANGHFVRNFDNGGYAADRAVNEEFSKSPNYRFTTADIRDLDFLPECDVIVNFAAESHVDNAISNPRNFADHSPRRPEFA